MKILIAYASASGGSQSMAQLLASLLQNHEVSLADLAKDNPDPALFDYAVIGGPVRMGKALPPLRRYLADRESALCAVPHTLFLCCAYADQFENYCARIFPQDLLAGAEQVLYFGGELVPAKVHGLRRLLVRSMRNEILESEDTDAALPGLLPEHVRILSDRLREK